MKNSLLISLLIFSASTPLDAALFRWVDESGKVHYSDRLPPKVAQKGHTKLNKNGTTKEEVASAKARKRNLLAIQEEKERQAALKEAKKLASLQEMQDTQLLSIYSNIEELERVYKNKIEMANGSIKVLKSRHKALSEKLEGLEARHERMVNPAHKRKLGMKIEDMLDNLNIYQQAITENLIERDDLQKRFKKDFTRFKKITSG